MRSIALPLAAAGMLLAANASAQYETPVATATPTETATPVMTADPTPTPAPVATPEPEKKKSEVSTGATKLSVGGTMFATYAYALGDVDGNPNGFDITRAYVNLYPSWGDTLDGRITYDIVRQAPGVTEGGEAVTDNTTESLVARVKYAYLMKHIGGDMLELTFGSQPTPYIQLEEDLFGYRLLARSAAEEFFGVATTDMGFGAKARFLGKRVEIMSNVQNGEGYSKQEKNKYKELATKVSVTILPNDKGGLKVHAYYGYSLKDQDADKVRAIGVISWQSAMFMAAANYTMSQDGDGAGTHVIGQGASVFGYVNLPFALPGTVGTRIVGRVDQLDKDVDVEAKDGDLELLRTILGVSFRLHDKAQLVLDYQSYELAENKGGDSQTLFAHVEMKF